MICVWWQSFGMTLSLLLIERNYIADRFELTDQIRPALAQICHYGSALQNLHKVTSYQVSRKNVHEPEEADFLNSFFMDAVVSGD